MGYNKKSSSVTRRMSTDIGFNIDSLRLKNIINKLGKYTRKNILNIGLSTGIILGSLGIAQEAQANIQNDTIWGEGIFRTNNTETGSPVKYVNLTVRPIEMQETIPNKKYYFTTDFTGSAVFSQQETPPNGLPVFIDIVDGTNEKNKENKQIIASASGEINAFFKEQTKGNIQLYDLQGREIYNKDFNTDKLYLNASEIPTGVYITRISTKKGNYSKKFIKTNNQTKGPLANPEYTEKKDLKNTEEEYATYMVKYEKEGYLTDSIEVTIGENFNWYDIYMTQIPPLTQDIIFTIKNLEQENLENVLVYLKYTDNNTLKDSARTNTRTSRIPKQHTRRRIHRKHRRIKQLQSMERIRTKHSRRNKQPRRHNKNCKRHPIPRRNKRKRRNSKSKRIQRKRNIRRIQHHLINLRHHKSLLRRKHLHTRTIRSSHGMARRIHKPNRNKIQQQLFRTIRLQQLHE